MGELRPEDAFLAGYKPSCICQENNPRLKPWLDKLKAGNYPYLFPVNILGDAYMFFHTEQQKHEYLKTMEGVEINSTEYCQKMGHILGFPPHSVDFFCRLWDMEEQGIDVDELRKREGIKVNFSGFMFKGHIPHLIEDISWLWDTYNHPEARKHPTIIGGMGQEETILEFGDYDGLKKLYHRLTDEKAVTA